MTDCYLVPVNDVERIIVSPQGGEGKLRDEVCDRVVPVRDTDGFEVGVHGCDFVHRADHLQEKLANVDPTEVRGAVRNEGIDSSVSETTKKATSLCKDHEETHVGS